MARKFPKKVLESTPTPAPIPTPASADDEISIEIDVVDAPIELAGAIVSTVTLPSGQIMPTAAFFDISDAPVILTTEPEEPAPQPAPQAVPQASFIPSVPPSAPPQPPAPPRHDPRCDADKRHYSNCGCIGTARGPFA